MTWLLTRNKAVNIFHSVLSSDKGCQLVLHYRYNKMKTIIIMATWAEHFLRIQWTKVNFSAYTMVTTSQDINQMIYFKAFNCTYFRTFVSQSDSSIQQPRRIRWDFNSISHLKCCINVDRGEKFDSAFSESDSVLFVFVIKKIRKI